LHSQVQQEEEVNFSRKFLQGGGDLEVGVVNLLVLACV